MAQADTTPSNGVPELSDFQRDVLFVLAGIGPANGQAIKREVAEYRPEEINHGRLYPNLDTLADRGLLEKREADGRTNSYRVTARGVSVLQARTEWEREQLEGVKA